MPSRHTRAQRHQEVARTAWATRQEIKHNRKPHRARHREWRCVDHYDPEALEALPAEERVMPRGERERRQATLAAVAQASIEPAAAEPVPAAAPLGCGVVVQVASGLCRVDLDGRVLLCSLRGSLSACDTGYTNVVAVGDEVRVGEDGTGQGVVEEVLSRRSVLARRDPFYSHLRQIVVANVDQVLVVASWREPALWFELLDRYLVAAARSGLTPVICLNKIDLAGDEGACRAALAAHTGLGYRAVLTSAATGEGVAELRTLLRGRTTVLAGLSGVGKSSLLAAVQPGLALRTGEVSERRHEGRHTTTQTTLHRLAGGGFVVDTPGIREFGLAGLRRSELLHYYPEIAAAASGCRYADCDHGDAPGCAVRQAAEQGLIAAVRYDSYRRIAAGLQE